MSNIIPDDFNRKELIDGILNYFNAGLSLIYPYARVKDITIENNLLYFHISLNITDTINYRKYYYNLLELVSTTVDDGMFSTEMRYAVMKSLRNSKINSILS
jgi:hypothetical protein